MRGFELVTPSTWKKDCVKILQYINSFKKDKLYSNGEKLLTANDVYPYIKLPRRATTYAAGYDIYSPFDFTLKPGDDLIIPTGFKIYMQTDEFFAILPRSGLGFKYYSRLANTIGIVDSDYYNNVTNEGHCFIKIRNEGNQAALEIKQGEAFAQGIFQKYLVADNETSSGVRNGGLGSTG